MLSVGQRMQDAIPLEELYTSIDRHWQAQQEVRATEAALADRAQQHRAVQKRLLMRFKDRQPSSIAHLDLLLAQTFQQLLQLGAFHLPCSLSEPLLTWLLAMLNQSQS